MFHGAIAFNQYIGKWNVSRVWNMDNMFSNAFVFNQDIGKWNVSNVSRMPYIFYMAIAFNQYIGKWPIRRDCYDPNIFSCSGVSKETFEGKLYSNKIAEYFNLDKPDEDKVWEPYTRWERRKNAVMFFSSISKMDIDEESIESKKLNLIRKIDYDVYKEIVSFI